jgi:hypothetical protein
MGAQTLGTRKEGLVSPLSRTSHVWRQTVYWWAERGTQVLRSTLGSEVKPSKPQHEEERLVLSLVIEHQSSSRTIHTGLTSQHGHSISLGKIARSVEEV